jgi:hypothetical protein
LVRFVQGGVIPTTANGVLAPPQARFARVLPKTILGRIKNFALFSIIEPIWPAKEQRLAAANQSLS